MLEYTCFANLRACFKEISLNASISIFTMALMNGILQAPLSAIIFMPNKIAIRYHPLIDKPSVLYSLGYLKAFMRGIFS
ncbi:MULTISPECIES: hypothetical protein [unclassified Bartonella]|uniref:hypothetical protein n=1 Tax=unclassified Bartonella TaxID=2645622 RepID=UPI0035CECF91